MLATKLEGLRTSNTYDVPTVCVNHRKMNYKAVIVCSVAGGGMRRMAVGEAWLLNII